MYVYILLKIKIMYNNINITLQNCDFIIVLEVMIYFYEY